MFALKHISDPDEPNSMLRGMKGYELTASDLEFIEKMKEEKLVKKYQVAVWLQLLYLHLFDLILLRRQCPHALRCFYWSQSHLEHVQKLLRRETMALEFECALRDMAEAERNKVSCVDLQ